MDLLKCGQCGDRPGLLMTVKDRAANSEINLCYGCYKKWLNSSKGPDSNVKREDWDRLSVVFEDGVSER